jgi:dTDP-4-amino-4,6-dideoxygalactose transaminase
LIDDKQSPEKIGATQMRDEGFLPFSRPSIGEKEIEEVVATLRSGWITTGIKTQRFERAFGHYVGSKHAVGLSSATAGLHLGLIALDIGPGDEVITSPLTFVATVNQIVLTGARAVLIDIDPNTLMIDTNRIEERITDRTKAILPVHFAGAPADMDPIVDLAKKHGLKILEDAAHGLGTRYKSRHVGPIGDAGVFSFHPIKNITTGEGGMFVTDDDGLANTVRLLKFHGLSSEAWERYHRNGVPEVELVMPGYKYNMTDLQASLGIHQLAKLDRFNQRRAKLADLYTRLLSPMEVFHLPGLPSYDHQHGWHLYTVRLRTDRLGIDRDTFMKELKTRNIGTGLHFRAVHLYDHYAKTLGYPRGSLPVAEDTSERILSLPLFPGMGDDDVHDVAGAIRDILDHHGRNTRGSRISCSE